MKKLIYVCVLMMELLHFWPSSVTLYANLYHIRNILNTGLTMKSNNNSCKVFLLTYFLLCITVRYWRENSPIEVKSR